MEAGDLLDVVPIPEGPCVVVWRRQNHPGFDDWACRLLVEAMLRRNPDAVLLVLGMGDGFDILDEGDMARLGWVRAPQHRHPSLG